MTRLTPEDLRPLRYCVEGLDTDIRESTGCSLFELMCRTVGGTDTAGAFSNSRAAVVPVTAGKGAIAGFADAVVATLRHLGLTSYVTGRTDVLGVTEALDQGADIVLMADDDEFIAVDCRTGRYVANAEATGQGYAQALDAAAGGVAGREVAVLGLGRVGVAAAVRLSELGALVIAAEISPERVSSAAARLGGASVVGPEEALARADLVVEATPETNVIPDGWVRAGKYVSSPGIPLGMSETAAARLGLRLIHEPLAIGVGVMAGSLLLRRERARVMSGKEVSV